MANRLIIPPVVFAAALLAMFALHHLLPGPRLVPPAVAPLGLIPAVCGVALGGWAILGFLRVNTSPKPWETPTALVAGGPYRFTRNPMYLGLLLCLVGAALALGTSTPLLILPLFVLIVNVVFIRPEEAILGRIFGEQFRAYTTRVRRWL
jgi:protein-S-isoprenylcysteine O-methyltransferase Ste14